MDRRTGGALVLVIAMVAALAGASARKAIAGSGERGPVPGPPAVGSCVLTQLPEEASVSRYSGDISVTMDGVVHPYATTGPCGISSFGEVVGVLADGLDYLPPTGGYISEDPTTPSRRCAELGKAYLWDGDAPTDDMAVWWPATAPSFDTIGPSAIQKRMGQRWLACRSVAHSVSGATQVRYTGSVLGAAVDGDFAADLARCVDGPIDSIEIGFTACDQEHGGELLATTWSTTPSAAMTRRLDAECTDLARTMTGMSDPTAGGRLEVAFVELAVPVYGESGAMDPGDMVDVSYSCSLQLAPNAEAGWLTGPLLGLGTGDVPLG